MTDALEDLENFIIDVVINNRRGIRATMLRVVFRGLSGIYSAALYRHAAGLAPSAGFDGALMANAFAAKKK